MLNSFHLRCLLCNLRFKQRPNCCISLEKIILNFDDYFNFPTLWPFWFFHNIPHGKMDNSMRIGKRRDNYYQHHIVGHILGQMRNRGNILVNIGDGRLVLVVDFDMDLLKNGIAEMKKG